MIYQLLKDQPIWIDKVRLKTNNTTKVKMKLKLQSLTKLEVTQTHAD